MSMQRLLISLALICPNPATLPKECRLLFTSAAHIQALFRLDFFMEANNMNPDQTAPKEQSDLGPYCLQYIYRLYLRI